MPASATLTISSRGFLLFVLLLLGFLGGIRGQLAGQTGLLFEEAAKLTTGGFKGALLLLRVAVIQQRPSLLENIEDESFNWRFSQRRGFIQVADDFPAQYPEIVDVLADSFL